MPHEATKFCWQSQSAGIKPLDVNAVIVSVTPIRPGENAYQRYEGRF
jgi:hypothetical protein